MKPIHIIPKCIRHAIPETIRSRIIPRRSFMMQPEFTNHCNFRCHFCPHSRYGCETEGANRFDRPKGFMSRELFDLFCDSANRYARRVVLGFFGEQMLHPDFCEFMRVFPTRRRYKIIVFSNWSLATRETMAALMGVDNVRISMDASCADLFEQLRSGGAVLDLDGKSASSRFKTHVEKVEYWLALPNRPPTALKYTVSSVNEHDREAFVARFRPLLGDEDCIVTKPVISYGGAMRDKTMLSVECHVAEESRLTVAWNGDCSPCNLDVNMGLCVGNLLELRDMSLVISSQKYKDVLKGIRNREGLCVKCLDGNNHTSDRVYTRED